MPLRHDRRRRVLTDDVLAAEATAAGAGARPSATNMESYAAAARRERQPHIVDLVPLGWLGQTLVFLSGATAIAGLELVYTWLPQWEASVGAASLAGLDLAGPGSLAHWLSSMLLAGAAGLGWLVYRLRSHRIDDYRGRYRVWRLLAPALLLLSVNEIAPLDRLAAGLARLALAGVSIDHEGWWVFGCATCWLALAVRAMAETWRSRGATFVLALAAIDLLMVATAGQWLPLDLDAAQRAMLLGGMRMFGHLLLFSGVSLYARNVILDAEGRLKRRAAAKASPKRKRREKSAPATEADSKPSPAKGTATSIDPPQKPRGPVSLPRTDLDAPRPATTPKPAPSLMDDSDDEEEENGGSHEFAGLTRAERKRLKRQQRQGRDV